LRESLKGCYQGSTSSDGTLSFYHDENPHYSLGAGGGQGAMDCKPIYLKASLGVESLRAIGGHHLGRVSKVFLRKTRPWNEGSKINSR